MVLHTTPEHEELKAIAGECMTKHHAHHYLGFAATQWKLFSKETSPRVKPLLYANLVHLNDEFQLPYLPELIDQKINGTEKGTLDDADIAFHQQEYERLCDELKSAFEKSQHPERPSSQAALNDLLLRLRKDRNVCD